MSHPAGTIALRESEVTSVLTSVLQLARGGTACGSDGLTMAAGRAAAGRIAQAGERQVRVVVNENDFLVWSVLGEQGWS